MTMMEEIMEKLGVELNEVFSVDIPASGESCEKVMFAKDGTTNIVLAEDINGIGIYNDLLLRSIMNGTAIIIKKRWIPEKNEGYYFVRPDGTIYEVFNDLERADLNSIIIGNCYKTFKKAEEHVDYWKRIYKDMPEFKEVEK